MPTPSPDLAVVVPTHGRPERLRALLARLAGQTLTPARFEVVVVDDGSPEPVQLDPAAHAFALTLLRQPCAGPAAARNRALEHVRAPLVLILNDDAVPAPDLLERHLAIRAERAQVNGGRFAVLGTFDFTPAAQADPFVRLLQEGSLLFDFAGLRHDALHDWTYFWTCNLSLPTAALREVGGFDAERFPAALLEDVELGYRLQQRGWRVLHRRDARAEHDHVLEPAAYFRRAHALGRYRLRMARKHRDASLFGAGPEAGPGDERERALHVAAEGLSPLVPGVVAQLQELRATGHPAPAALSEQLRELVRQVAWGPIAAGHLAEAEGADVQGVLERGPPRGELTSVIVLSCDALERTRRCLAALRRHADPDHPTELLVVDNGSTDGSREWLAAQPDVRLIANATNAGAPRARNQALARARGAWLVFLDNDALVTPGWLSGLLRHAALDPRAGCVGPVSDRAAHGQQVPLTVADDDASVEAFARDRALRRRGLFRYRAVLSSFCLLARRAAVEAVGGFDERFSPWGYEDDDFTLRVLLAGFRNRIAEDVFVRHVDYGGAKLARHHALLRENRARFLAKWGLLDEDPPAATGYGRYEPLVRRTWTDAELRVPLAEPAEESAREPVDGAPPPALPSAPEPWATKHT